MTLKHLILSGAILIIIIGGAILSWHAWEDHAARKRINIGLTAVHTGMTPAEVGRLLGPPTFDQHPIDEVFQPRSGVCKNESSSVFVYQARRNESLFVYFDKQGRVTCVERMMAWRVLRT